jgi:hypothetical protein
MLPTFRGQIAPKIPARLARSYYAVATAHAAMGLIAELLGVYIILVAGSAFCLSACDLSAINLGCEQGW